MDKKVSIFGKNYVISNNEDEEKILQAAGVVDTMMKEAAKDQPDVSSSQIAVLVCLQLATDLREKQKLLWSVEKRVENLTLHINKQV